MKRTPLKQKRAKQATTTVKSQIVARSNGQCEARLDGCAGAGHHLHHVLRRSQGGKETVDNLIHVCWTCHNTIHANPADALERGLLARKQTGEP